MISLISIINNGTIEDMNTKASLEQADLVLMNGRIYTINSENNVAEAVAIKNGKIIFVGRNEDIKKYCGECTKVINLEQKTVLPGFIETHIHSPGTAYTELYNINLHDTVSINEILKIIETFIEKNPESELYYGRGFVGAIFKGIENILGPAKERLDEICNDKPIILTDFGGHTHWLNSKAFEYFGITKETEDPIGGIIEKNPDTGELWGTLKDEAKVLFSDKIFNIDEKIGATKHFQKKLNSLGYTSIFALRPGGTSIRFTEFEAYEYLENNDELTLRVHGARDIYPDQDIGEQLSELKDIKYKYESDLIKVNTAKYFADGVIEGLTGFLLNPYELEAGKGDHYYGKPIWEINKMMEAFDKTLESGFQIHVHSIGDGATKNTLDALEYAQGKNGDVDFRNVITHLQLVSPSDIKRMERLNVVANVQPYWHFKDPISWFDAEYPFIGTRAETEYPLKSFLNSGVKVTASSDHPVTSIPNPFVAIQAAVTRNLVGAKKYGLDSIKNIDDPKWLLNSNERVSVDEIVRAFTIDSAYSLFMENEVGSIEEGKYADLVIIDRNIFEIEPIDIEKTKVIATLFNGKIVFSSKDNKLF